MMKYKVIVVVLILTVTGCGYTQPSSLPRLPAESLHPSESSPLQPEEVITMKLPAPQLKGNISLEETLQARRSIIDFSDAALTIEEVSQLLWAAQGITSSRGGRTAPSAGATYPLQLYLVAGNVESLAPGVYKYHPQKHELGKIKEVDVRKELADAALNQEWVEQAPASIVIAAIYEKTTARYGDRGIRYVHLEAGHAAQNICLQAVALGLGSVPIGAFYDERVGNVTGISSGETPLYILPVGQPSQ